jgi:hypothetical protein
MSGAMATTERRAGGDAATACVDATSTTASDDRLGTLLSRMECQRDVLRAVLEACDEPRTIEQIEDATRDARERHRSIFGVDALCLQLEQAGALQRVCASGGPYDEDVLGDIETTEVVDGVEYLERREPPAVLWRLTEHGHAALAARDPLAGFEALCARDARHVPIYREILAMCGRDGGATVGDISKAVDDSPLCQSPRLYAAHFIDNLEACGAVTWGPPWVATDAGLRGLEMLDDGDATR